MKIGDRVMVTYAPVGGFTHPFLNMVGTVIHVDAVGSLVPYLILFNPEETDKKKWITSWFLNGRLEVIG